MQLVVAMTMNLDSWSRRLRMLELTAHAQMISLKLLLNMLFILKLVPIDAIGR